MVQLHKIKPFWVSISAFPNPRTKNYALLNTAMDWTVPPQSVYVQILTPNVTIICDLLFMEAVKGKGGHRSGTLIQ